MSLCVYYLFLFDHVLLLSLLFLLVRLDGAFHFILFRSRFFCYLFFYYYYCLPGFLYGYGYGCRSDFSALTLKSSIGTHKCT